MVRGKGGGREMPFSASRNQHTALQDAFAVKFAKQRGGGTRRSREEMEEGASQGEECHPPVLGRGIAAQVAAVLGTLNQIIRTQGT